MGCAIFVHPWDMELKGRMSKYWLPWLVGKSLIFQPLDFSVCIADLHCLDLESAQCYQKRLVVGMPGETAQAICCMIFGGVLERHPNLKVCFAHGGKKS